MLTTAVIDLAGKLAVIFLLMHHTDKSINIQSAIIHVIYDTKYRP
jgi:Co/Zn/Cd efflux system component